MTSAKLLIIFLFLFTRPRSAHSLRSTGISRRSAIIMSGAANSIRGEKVRWGIVGLGDVTQLKSGPPFWKCKHSELVAAMRRTPGKAKEWASRVPGGACVGYDRLDDFLQHKGMDAVYVATRPGSHLEIIREVVKISTIQAIYVEKPVGRCAAETREIVRLCTTNSKNLYTAYISRAYERTQKVRQLLPKVGKLTEIRYSLKGQGGARNMGGQVPWRLNPSDSGGGLIMDVGCHVIDRIDYLVGPLSNVKGSSSRTDKNSLVEDNVKIKAEIVETDGQTDQPITVTMTWDFCSKDNLDELEFSGSLGTLKMAAMSPSLPVFFNEELFDFEQPEHTAQAMIQAVTDEICGFGSAPFLSRGENAIRTSEVIDRALFDFYGNRDIGYWE